LFSIANQNIYFRRKSKNTLTGVFQLCLCCCFDDPFSCCYVQISFSVGHRIKSIPIRSCVKRRKNEQHLIWSCWNIVCFLVFLPKQFFWRTHISPKCNSKLFSEMTTSVSSWHTRCCWSRVCLRENGWKWCCSLRSIDPCLYRAPVNVLLRPLLGSRPVTFVVHIIDAVILWIQRTIKSP